MDQQKSSIMFFVAAAVVAAMTALVALVNALPSLETSVNSADSAGRILGSLMMTGILCAIGFGGSLLLYSIGMAQKYPETHSSTGRLKQIHEATKELRITDTSESEFYRNATEFELLSFYKQLAKSGDQSKLHALVLEVRRRLSS